MRKKQVNARNTFLLLFYTALTVGVLMILLMAFFDN